MHCIVCDTYRSKRAKGVACKMCTEALNTFPVETRLIMKMPVAERAKMLTVLKKRTYEYIKRRTRELVPGSRHTIRVWVALGNDGTPVKLGFTRKELMHMRLDIVLGQFSYTIPDRI